MMPVTHFEFRCKDTADFNESLKTFARIQVPMSKWRPDNSPEGGSFEMDDAHRLTLIVRDGPEYLPSFMLQKVKEKEKRMLDWRFSVASPINWNIRFSDPKTPPYFNSDDFHKPCPPPRIEVFIGAGGAIVWNDVKVPANVRVIDQRAEAAPVKSANGGLVRGTIYSMITGKPIANAEIVLLAETDVPKQGEPEAPKEFSRTKTDAHGFAEISAVPARRYSVVVRADKFAARVQGEYVNKANTVHEFALELLTQNSLKGTVTDSAGHPLAGLSVSAGSPLGVDGASYACADAAPAKTDDQGRFEIRSLPWQGFAYVECRSPARHQTSDSRGLLKIPTDDIKIVMTGTGTVHGKAPAGNILVHIQPPGGNRVGTWGGSLKAGADGSFEFKDVPPGEYLVSADPMFPIEGKAADAKAVTVKAGETVEVEIMKVGKK
jgi:hypothetical protein